MLPGSRQSYRVRAGSYSLDYAGEAGRLQRTRIEVAAQSVQEVAIARYPGAICKLEIAFRRTPTNHPPLAMIRALGADGAACTVTTTFDLARGVAVGSIDLAAGNYELEVCSGRGERARLEFVVPANGSPQKLTVELP